MEGNIVLLGDEAIAQGALDAGMSGIYAYPGTPSTEITEYVQKSKQAKNNAIHSDWSANEKTAYEAALGMSYAGKRSMVCMKHVGLNVAADAFINSAITGINGGMILVVADDPSMHSSQNEQDSRFYAKFAMIACFEPANQQEAYDMAYKGFEFSETTKLPVMIRITTRLAHSRSIIERLSLISQNELKLSSDLKQFVLLPSIAKQRYKGLIESQKSILQLSNNSEFNHYFEGENKSLGIIASGIAFNYYKEIETEKRLNYPIIKISQYPVPDKMITRLYSECDELLILEEGYPFIEEILKGFFELDKSIHGRLNGKLPRDGELNPDLVLSALGFETHISYSTPDIIKSRPPQLCKGCSHADIYDALGIALEKYSKGRVFSDIGCYTLGALKPYEIINSCVDMGASVTMAKGASDAGLHPSVCVIGDSTFTHSGMTGLLDCVMEKTPITIIISDNSTTGMTGGQKSHATGRLFEICKGIGVEEEHIKLLIPIKKQLHENAGIISNELEYNGVSVIIGNRECIQTAVRKVKQKSISE